MYTPSVVAAMGLGKLIAFFLIWLNSLRKPVELITPPTNLTSVPVIFFDKDYIKNLKL
jgi:hypothetical protein